MKDIYVADVGKFENQAVVTFFAVRSKQLRSRKDGGQYMAVTLADRTGQIESRMWENFAEAAPGFEAGDVVKVRAEVCRFNDRLQLNLEKLRRANAEEFELADYVPQTSKDVDELWSSLVRTVDTFTDHWLQALVRSFLDDRLVQGSLVFCGLRRCGHVHRCSRVVVAEAGNINGATASAEARLLGVVRSRGSGKVEVKGRWRSW